jgi:histidine ammonia-lyase
MSLEALMGSNAAFDARIHALRPHPGQQASAANLRALTADSGIIASHRDCTRVQDAYSLRCMPQVHGACREAIRFAGEIIAQMDSVTDSPLPLRRRWRRPLRKLPRPASSPGDGHPRHGLTQLAGISSVASTSW